MPTSRIAFHGCCEGASKFTLSFAIPDKLHRKSPYQLLRKLRSKRFLPFKPACRGQWGCLSHGGRFGDISKP